MKKKLFFSAMSVCILTFGLVFVSCDNGSDGKNDPKTLVIKNIPEEVFYYGYYGGGGIGIFSAGITPEQALSMIGLVAGADLDNDDIRITGSGPYTMTIPLYDFDNGKRWTGSGTFDVYVVLYGGGEHYYKASVNFSSGTTTVSFNSATEIFP